MRLKATKKEVIGLIKKIKISQHSVLDKEKIEMMKNFSVEIKEDGTWEIFGQYNKELWYLFVNYKGRSEGSTGLYLDSDFIEYVK